MSEKLCVFCKHCVLDTMGCHGDYPDPATFECRKGHWRAEVSGSGWSPIAEDEPFRESILAAETCPDYEQVKP